MSMLTTTCPHCGTIDIALKVIGFDGNERAGLVNAYTSCPRCSMPSCHELWAGPGARAAPQWFATGASRESTTEVLAASGWRIKETFPAPKLHAAPPETPPEVERIYLQAKSTHQRCELDAAAMLYRKVLETAIKGLAPAGKGSLDARIKELTKSDLIPEAVATWAHEIRGVGNDGAHEADAPSEDDVAQAAEFVEAFLTYAFTMPAKIDSRKSKKAETILQQQ